MDFEAIIDRECPAPIHWLTHRRYVIGRVKYEVEKRDARIGELESIVKNFDAFVAALAAIGPHAGKPDSHIEALLDKAKRVSALESTERELREAVRVLAELATTCSCVDQGWCSVCSKIRAAVMANPIAAAAVREAGKQ